MKPTFLEFFAGAGMARAGLGKGWRCLFANDIDLKKAATYDDNWGKGAMVPGDVKTVDMSHVIEQPDLVWASFPCQDLSLAGAGAGLKGDRSGTFWPFWKQISKLVDDGRAPTIVALENVAATLTSHRGRDFEALCLALVEKGYKVGARVVDAVQFVPQSRPRMFLIAIRADAEIPANLIETSGSLEGVDKQVATAFTLIKERAKAESKLQPVVDSWINWSLPAPKTKRPALDELIEHEPVGVQWHSDAETRTLLERMSELNKRKVEKAKASGKRMIGTAYRRTRVESGKKSVRTEVRFDGIAGCLRTPSGGSSRQIVIEVENGRVRSRLMTIREGARLMGMPEKYRLPAAYNEGYHLVGDGVCVAVVSYLARSLFEPIIRQNQDMADAA
ncbi:DNA-cytosine methyltransferase [Sphingobium indicum IP26]|uniref:Cytosine-specific methyltransferase n=1 Tax=Sphingobium indicum F2 TaxID=1450518 RepID=A0A8E0WUG0_9SPHN|nr:DNA cytosine methyltransferase [Sphingobium indicum]EPR17529.1 DNA-cytosine methyltransferase [Sphingobium indicum IP26]KER37631.1 cytosine methyltransferase [Sphingobium indicum F2]